MTDDDEVKSHFDLTLTGSETLPTTVLFEPGAGQYVIEPAQNLHIAIEAPESERLEISGGPDFIAVWLGPSMQVVVTDFQGDRLPLLGF